jgi:acyl-CoA thioesterase FadM
LGVPARLVAAGDTPDRAATRVWVAREAGFKATQQADLRLGHAGAAGDAVLFRGPDGPAVLTLPFSPPGGAERVVGVVVRAADPGPPQTAPADFTFGFRTRLQDFAGPSGIPNPARVAEWVGQAREAALAPVAGRLFADLAARHCGLLTRAVNLKVVGRAAAFDAVEARYRLDRLTDTGFEFGIDFARPTDGGPAPLARAVAEVRCVHLAGPHAGQPAPFPDYLAGHLRRLAGHHPLPGDGAAGFPAGRTLAVPEPAPVVAAETVQTTPDDANAAGNVYFTRLFEWQAAAAWRWLHAVLPDASEGAAVPVAARIDFHREAFPFQTVEVRLVLEALTERGLELRCEFTRHRANGPAECVAVGRQTLAWVRHGGDHPVVTPWPRQAREALEAVLTPSRV